MRTILAAFILLAGAATVHAQQTPIAPERARAISGLLQRCVAVPSNTPKPFDVVLKVAIENGRLNHASVSAYRSARSPGHRAAADAVIASLRSCSSLRDVPSGSYTVPVVLR